jgi:hypothetical protein
MNISMLSTAAATTFLIATALNANFYSSAGALYERGALGGNALLTSYLNAMAPQFA